MWTRVFIGLGAVLVLAVIGGILFLYTDDPYESAAYPERLTRTSHADLPHVSPPETSDTTTALNIHTEGTRFVAPDGRSMYLRGINLGGSNKVPFDPYLPTHVRDGFFEGRSVSFVGRPFPLDDADRHFRRLANWGFHFVRLVITWEAVEHAGPGQYDEAYLDYLRILAETAAEHNINLFVDPHQDVFSRFTGGDGAPKWVFDTLGIDVRALSPTGAALVHNVREDAYPDMGWITNYNKMGAATLFTLFFGGNDFAPQTTLHGEPVQDYLQRHYIAAIQQVARRLSGLPNVIGYDTLNEPSYGYIGQETLDQRGVAKIGAMPTLAQGLFLAAGFPQEVRVYEFGLFGAEETNRITLNPDGRSVWMDDRVPIWRTHGVWTVSDNGTPTIADPDYFAQVDGKPVDPANDYLKPFIERYRAAIHEADPDALLFVEGPVQGDLPDWNVDRTETFVHAGHWYDVGTLLTKEYSPILSVDAEQERLLLGKTAIRQAFERQLASMKEETKTHLGPRPTLVGEFGVPFDLNEGEAFRTGDFSAQRAALDRSFNAIEANLLSYTLWNYTADNTNTHGDQWNGEDLSIVSRDQQAEMPGLQAGGRALPVVIRPYPYKVAGHLTTYQFHAERQELLVRFVPDSTLENPTEVFLPPFHYGDGFTVRSTPAELTWNSDRHLLRIDPTDPSADQEVLVRPE